MSEDSVPITVLGAGPIGLMAAAIVKHAGARFVVVTDVNPYRLELAKKMGATVTLNVTDGSLDDTMNDLGMEEGFDVGMEMSGDPTALRDLLRVLHHGGRAALLGIPSGETAVDWKDIIFKGLILKGIYGREMFETWYKMASMLQSGLDVSPIITHHFDVADYEQAFQLMESGQSGKVILNWC